MAQAAAIKQKSAPAPAVKQTPVFKWTGKTKQGEVRSGEMEAADGEAVEARLRQMGIEPTKVKKKPKEFHLSLPGFGGRDDEGHPRLHPPVRGDDRRRPAAGAGLDILGTQADNPAFKKVLLQVKARVESGSTFADALARAPQGLRRALRPARRAGEIGGILDTILQRLGAYIEKNEKLARRVKGAMVYPAIVLVVAVGVTVVLLAFVIPTFEKMFKDFGGALPAPTQFVIDLSHGLQENWYLVRRDPDRVRRRLQALRAQPEGPGAVGRLHR